MEIFLQLWGGIFSLLAKVFLAKSEKEKGDSWRLRGWIVYLLGIPAWVIVLAQNHNWIAMSLEAGGVPGIILGIVVSMKNLDRAPRLLDLCTKVFVWILIVFGVGYSIYDFGGINSISQVLECGTTVGFLLGTYLLAKKNPRGWLWFMLMNVSMGILMTMQEKWIFASLQIVSLYFVILGFRRANTLSRTSNIRSPGR